MKKDFIAEAIFEYEAMTAKEQGKLVLQILEDQPVLMGFITNLADDFSDEAHETLVDSLAILINAFIAAGIPVDLIARDTVDEVIDEKVEKYDQAESEKGVEDLVDSPLVLEDLKARALLKGKFDKDDEEGKANFSMVLDTVITIVERSVAYGMEKHRQE